VHCALAQGQWNSALGMLILKLHATGNCHSNQQENPTFMQLLKRRFKTFPMAMLQHITVKL
jgi:hypothetical protein